MYNNTTNLYLYISVLRRRNMGIEFTKGEIERNTETITWFVRFYGTKDAQEMVLNFFF